VLSLSSNTACAVLAVRRAVASAAAFAFAAAVVGSSGGGVLATARAALRRAVVTDCANGDGVPDGAAGSEGSLASGSSVSGPTISHQRRPMSSMAVASSSATVNASRHNARSLRSFCAPSTALTARATGAVSARVRMPPSVRPSSSAAICAASRAVIFGASVGSSALVSLRIRLVAEARSQCRSAVRRRICAASMRGSSSRSAAA
jgi:hypothetical protein